MIDLRKSAPLLIGIVLVITGLIMGVMYITSTHSVKIHSNNVSNVTISKMSDTGHPIATVNKSEDTVRLANDVDYIISYKGVGDFGDGSIVLDKHTKDINITPDFSSQKYTSLMALALPIAHNLIEQQYPNTDSLFTVTNGGMIERGKWYLIKLIHTGEYTYTSDDLRILLENVDGKWELKTKPDIILTQVAYPSIPLEILSWADKL